MKRWITALMMVVLLGGTVFAQGEYRIIHYLIASGGGNSAQGAYNLDASIGQVLAVSSTGGPFALCSGFWCGAAAEYTVYLPLVLREGW